LTAQVTIGSSHGWRNPMRKSTRPRFCILPGRPSQRSGRRSRHQSRCHA